MYRRRKFTIQRFEGFKFKLWFDNAKESSLTALYAMLWSLWLKIDNNRIIKIVDGEGRLDSDGLDSVQSYKSRCRVILSKNNKGYIIHKFYTNTKNIWRSFDIF